MDLPSGGVQSANLRLARFLKRRRIAYALLLLFPLGAHRLYLEDRRGALLEFRWIDSALARINKRLRIEVYMSQTVPRQATGVALRPTRPALIHRGRTAHFPFLNRSSSCVTP